jgi:hypothetical protein
MRVADPGPDVELLAALDAGLLAPRRAAEVRAAARDDPRASAVLDALAATRADLAALLVPPVPAEAARSWAGALEAAPPFPQPAEDRAEDGDGPGEGAGAVVRPFRRRALAALVAAAAVVALVAGGVALTAGPERTALGRVELVAVARSTIGMDDLGPLADPARRAACLARLGAPDDVAGGRTVRYEDVPGVLLVLTTGTLGRFRVLVVDDACSAVLADAVVG